MLTVKTGHGCELIQYATALNPVPLRIPPCNCCHQLVARRHLPPESLIKFDRNAHRHADPSHH
jgi:hypothetical protein